MINVQNTAHFISQLSSKYSNIPDITQPDVYESPDTPEESDAVDNGSISITNTNLIAATDKLDQNMQILVQPHHSGSISRKANALVGELDKVNELKNKKLLNKQQETEIDKQQRIS
ncbi:3476_t:CDS:2 [Entrophospora sp. SA101]|nr:3476_t:CDS:2 [Entrophospora sp. SA101]